MLPQLTRLVPEIFEPTAHALPSMALQDPNSTVRQAVATVLPQLLSAEQATPVLLRAVAEDPTDAVRAAAARALPLRPETANLTVPVLLRVATENKSLPLCKKAAEEVLMNAAPEAAQWLDPEIAERVALVLLQASGNHVRLSAVKILPQLTRLLPKIVEHTAHVLPSMALQDPNSTVRQAVATVLPQLLAAEQATPVLLRAVANDTDELVRMAAISGLPKLLGPKNAERAAPVLLQAVVEDTHAKVGQQAVRILLRLGPKAVELANASFRNLLLEANCSMRAFRHLGNLADFFILLEPATFDRVVPTLALALDSALLCMEAHTEGSVAATEVLIEIGKAMARAAPASRLQAMDILIQAEKAARWKDISGIRHSRNFLEFSAHRAFEAKCASLFLKQTAKSIHIDNFTVDIPHGVMMVSDAYGTESYRCANRAACPAVRNQKMKLRRVSDSTKLIKDDCPLVLSTSHGSSSGAADQISSGCATGFDPASVGCTRCLPGFGRKSSDPVACEPCAQSDWATRRLVWLAQPLLIFLLSLRSAENVAASKGMAEAMANDVFKIGLVYLSTASMVVSAATSTDTFREMNATGLAGQMAFLARQLQRGDVTYSSSSDCVLMNGEGAASVDQHLALSLQLPACVVAIVGTFIIVRACCRVAFSGGTNRLKEFQDEVASRMFTCSLVAGNQFLPGVVSACMHALSCIHIQRSVDGKDPIQYMAYAPDMECRRRTRFLGTCGPALVFAFVAGPVYWLTLLRRQQGMQRAGPLKFLTGSYRCGFTWWEAGRLIKTMMISSIVALSPTGYCALQQLMLCLVITLAFTAWHCFHCPCEYLLINAVEAGSLLTLSLGMVLLGLLAGAKWTLTPSGKIEVLGTVAALVIVYFFVLVVAWVKVTFFWTDDSGDEPVAGDDQ
jgi:HEAT repeat protein